MASGSSKPKSDLERQYMSSSSRSKTDDLRTSKKPPEIAVPKPSSSILLISPQNEILLLQRIHTSSSFPSAHVFPGGNLDAYHESPVPTPSSPERHRDSEVYRLGGVRECFEECGILLAKKNQVKGKEKEMNGDDVELVMVSEEEREKARRDIYSKKTRFADWVEGIGGIVDTEGLIPFTRWITPSNLPNRFTTQMYVYFLPLDLSSPLGLGQEGDKEKVIQIPKDDGIEHTSASFAYCEEWVQKARKNEIILFPPQFYLLFLLSPFLPAPPALGKHFSRDELQEQRENVRAFLKGDGGDGSGVQWGEKVMSPSPMKLGVKSNRGDGRVVLELVKQGPELEMEGRCGDAKRVLLVRFLKEGPRDMNIRDRKEFLEEEKRGVDSKL
ncbi:hypothetical protein NHQ30_002824 [Ciborinia camelliae]|nr:hypothetical protein NHQ30_002824 [Ciborinia camelliae]